ncbi:hypothetical protein CLV97_10182 [Planifilum fimeticola]|jgi:uncharacterized protein|uniref:Tic20 family protein n=1 Tax=Planifilum fimeticola TaxID=201975 RepID=A0A2T0LJB4_9BACL|nr:DUF4870 domain-containing protein [Planifilum fimeticola]PRX42594.1 hypothetical protein CLV97_10182 [Planifilum fimeticola]
MNALAPSGEEKLLAALCHGSALFFPILLPLIILLLKRDSLFVRNHAREALVFHLFMILVMFLCKLLFIVLIGFLLLGIAFLFYAVTTVIAVIRSLSGGEYRYPFTSQWARNL